MSHTDTARKEHVRQVESARQDAAHARRIAKVVAGLETS